MQPGDVIAGRFEIERVAGEGGMGVVLRARDREGGGAVAIKVLRDEVGAGVERFADEAAVLAGLDHPAIVRFIAHGRTASGAPYLAMEWLEGEDLDDRLARGPLSLDECVALASRVAEGLAAAHARGIVHRDIKPANLFLPDGDPARVKVLDFGIARRSAVARPRTGTGVMLGTLGYMAPEQARGERDIDARADVFALGCVLYECLTARPAFAGDNAMAVLAKILLDEAPRVREDRADVPAALDALIATMLAKPPAARPRDGAAVHAAIAAAMGAPRATATLPTEAPRALGSHEVRVVSVILAGAPPDVSGTATTSAASEAGTIERVRDVVSSFGARAEPMLGGAWLVSMAGAGAPTDQAARVARCALAIRAAWPEVPLAVATGRGEWTGRTPVGEVIDRATALLVAARTTAVALDALTADLVRDAFDVQTEGALSVLRGLRAVGAVRTLLGRSTPLVGRERELRALCDFYDECAGEPRARAVLVTAAPGVGKSRLRDEFVRALGQRAEVPRVWIARADPVGAGASFGLIAQLVRQAAGLAEGDDGATRAARLRACVEAAVAPADAPRVAAFLGEVIGARAPDADGEPLRAARQDPVLMGDQIARAWEDFVAGVVRAGAVVLVLEDLHWGDVPSVRLVDVALRTLAEQPLMVLALARPEVRELFPSLWSERDVQELRLGTLTRKAAEKLVRAMLPAEAATGARLDALLERAGGNAFYLEELIRAESEGHGTALPETVLAMVSARLEALPPEARRALRAASVFGETFRVRGVAALLGSDDAAGVEGVVADLVARELIGRHGGAGADGEPAYTFRHAFVRDAAYAMLTDADRALGHRLAGAWLEAAGLVDAGVLAEHFDRGQDAARAGECYQRAATHALEGNDFGAAIARSKRALELGATGDAAVALWLVQAEAHRWRAEWADAERCAARAAEGATGARWFHAAEIAMSALDMQGADARIGPWHVQAEARSGSAGDASAELSFWSVAMRFHSSRDASPESAMARTVTARLGASVVDVASLRARTPVLVMQATAKLWNGTGGVEPLDALEHAIGEIEAQGDLRTTAHSLTSLAFAQESYGDHAGAERSLRRSVALASRLGLEHVLALAQLNLAELVAERGALAEARPMLEAVQQKLHAQRSTRLETAARIALAEITFFQGDAVAAEREARVVFADSITVPHRVRAQTLMARCCLADGRLDEAVAAVARAARTAEGAPTASVLKPVASVVHAEVLERVGDHAGAVDVVRRAYARLAAIADRFARPEDRERFLLGSHARRRVAELAHAWDATRRDG